MAAQGVFAVVGGPGVLLSAVQGIAGCAKGACTVELSVTNHSILTIKFANVSKNIFYQTSLRVDHQAQTTNVIACQVFLKDFINALFCCSGFDQLDLIFDPDDSSLVKLRCSDQESTFNSEIRTLDLILSHEIPPSVPLGSLTADSEVISTAFSQCNDSGIDKVHVAFHWSLELKTSVPGGCDTHVVVPQSRMENLSGDNITMSIPGKEIGVITSFVSSLGKCNIELATSGLVFRKRLITGNDALLVVCACEN